MLIKSHQAESLCIQRIPQEFVNTESILSVVPRHRVLQAGDALIVWSAILRAVITVEEDLLSINDVAEPSGFRHVSEASPQPHEVSVGLPYPPDKEVVINVETPLSCCFSLDPGKYFCFDT